MHHGAKKFLKFKLTEGKTTIITETYDRAFVGVLIESLIWRRGRRALGVKWLNGKWRKRKGQCC